MKEKLLHERALVTCIAMLFICIILKLFGVQWFDLNTDIPILKTLDAIITDNIPLLFVNTLLFRFINGILIMCLIVKDYRKVINKSLYVLFISLVAILLNMLSLNSIIIVVYEFTSFIALSKILFKVSIKETIFVLILNILYQAISIYLRDINNPCTYYGFITNKLLSIDYNIRQISSAT